MSRSEFNHEPKLAPKVKITTISDSRQFTIKQPIPVKHNRCQLGKNPLPMISSPRRDPCHLFVHRLSLLKTLFLLLALLSFQKQCLCFKENHQQQHQAASYHHGIGPKVEALISPLEPAPISSIFGSLLGGSSAANTAAQQNLQAQADLHQAYKSGQASDKVTLPGDILLGGLFPIHMKGTKVECGEINRDRGIQRLEAMLYALDRINEDSKLLPKIKLGAILLDSCSSSTYALNQSLEFIRASINTVESSAFECKDKSTPRPKYGSKMIAGVIGGSYSEVSLQVANLLRLFRIPQVSYASTGTALSDKTLYDLFARTVPSDMFQARAIADIVERLNWSYVSLVSSEGLYGDSGSKEFMKQASARRICIATHEKISPTSDVNSYDSLVENLRKRNATGVVLFTRAEDTRELLIAVKRAQLLQNFAWVAADGWGTHQKLIEGVEEVAWGAITVELAAKAIPGFDQYMRGLTPWDNVRNPWFSEYWQEWFDCALQVNLVRQQELASGAGLFNRRDANSTTNPTDPKLPVGDNEANEDYAADEDAEEQEETGSGDKKKRKRRRRRTPVRTNLTAIAPAARRPKRQAAQLIAGGMTLANKMKQFCSPNLRISESNGYRQEQKVQFVVDAVYAMAHALHKAWYKLCDAQPGVVCEALKELNGAEFYGKYLLNVSFQDLAGSEVKFDERGDGLGRYNIYNFRRASNYRNLSSPSPQAVGAPVDLATTADDQANLGGGVTGEGSAQAPTLTENNNYENAFEVAQPSPAGPNGAAQNFNDGEHIYTSNVEFEYSPIGRWTESDYNLKLEDIEFIQGDKSIPESYCSKPCELGQAKIMRAGDHCCWICKTCAPYEYLPDEFSCKDCGIGRWPTADKTSCFELPQKILRWDSVYSLISLSIACMGIGLTAFVSIIFIKYIDTPVVKASGRELSFILLAGIAFCHLATFVLLSRPTTIVCTSQRFLVNFGFSLMYASLLVKTNRISRIFNCARKSAKRPSFISPRSQMIITAILVGIQVFLTIVWFVFEPPGTRADSPEGKRDEVILKCRVKGKSFIISLVYNMILITTCTVYAVKTRKIPENFNESKFIGFTMYTTIVIWLAFVTMFFGTNNSYEIQMNTMCVCISLSAYVTLFCLFSPKLSIILLHPDKNVRKLTMNSATYKRPFKPVSSFASVDGRGNNLTGGTYNGTGAAQTDGGSGGPMSTTSNVLNLGADNQAARFQESSIVSNVVNSNSSNSQKTPTTLSNQLGVCPSCGGQAAPAGSAPSGGVELHQVKQLAASAAAAACSPVGSHAATSTALANQEKSKLNSARPPGGAGSGGTGAAAKQQRPLTSGLMANTSLSRSSILVSTTAGLAAATTAASGGHARQPGSSGGVGASSIARSNSGNLTAAKVVHSKINNPAQNREGNLNKKRPLGAHEEQHSIMLVEGRRAPTNLPVGANQPDDNPLRKQQHQQAVSRHQMASLSRLNELASLTSGGPERLRVDESISNDSILLHAGSQPEIEPSGSGRPTGHYQQTGQHSIINQQRYLRQSELGQPANLMTVAAANSGCHNHNNSANLDDPIEDNRRVYVAGKGSDSMLWNQSLYSIDYCSDCCPSYCHCSCQACANSSQSNNDEENLETELGPATSGGAICIHSASQPAAAEVQPDQEELDDYEIMCDSLLLRDDSALDTITTSTCLQQQQQQQQQQHHHHQRQFDQQQMAIRRRKSDEPRKHSLLVEGERAYIVSSTGASRSAFKTKRSQTMEMRTLAYSNANNRERDSTSQPVQLRHSNSNRRLPASSSAASSLETNTNRPGTYAALQAAASSALGACTIVTGQLAAEHQEMKQTSSRDKFSSERRQEPQPSPTTSTPTGTIQASIELVKSNSEFRRRRGQAGRGNLKRRHRHREQGCFDYHDEYEYNYGLVQSQSDSESSYYRQARRPHADDSDLDAGDFISDVDDLEDNDEPSSSITRDDTCNSNKDDFYDDNFDHDGRLASHKLPSGRRKGSRQSGRSPKSGVPKMLEPDEHRINSVALIAATLSAGGAIVESGGGAGASSSTGSRQHELHDESESASDSGSNPANNQHQLHLRRQQQNNRDLYKQ